MFPGIPQDLLASGSGSATIGYACAAHDDSAAVGIAESVMLSCPDWPGNLPEGHYWSFAIVDGCVLYDIEAMNPCMIYLPGSGVSHGTLPTKFGEHVHHPGVGSALVTKADVLSENAKEWFSQFGHLLKVGAHIPKRAVKKGRRVSDDEIVRMASLIPGSLKRKVDALRNQESVLGWIV